MFIYTLIKNSEMTYLYNYIVLSITGDNMLCKKLWNYLVENIKYLNTSMWNVG